MDGSSSADTLGRMASLLREGGSDLSRPLAELARAAGADFALLLMVSSSEGKTWLVEGHGLRRSQGEKASELHSSYLFRQVTLAVDAPFQLIRHGWEEDPFLSGEGASCLLLGIHHAEGLHFSVVAGKRNKQLFDSRAGELFGVLSQFLGLAAERAYLLSEVQKWRDRDPLTGLAVYHSFYDTLRREVSRARRQGGRLSLALLSVEGVEEVARRKGRAEADAVLRRVADSLKANLRDNDVVGRYGPGEFGLLLIEVSPSIGRMVADRLLRGVNEAVADPQAGISFRMGFASYPEEATSTEKLIEMGEGALSRARESDSVKAVRWRK